MGSLTADLIVACSDENRRGGIKSIYVADRTTVESFTAGAGHDYTAVTMVTPASDEFYELQFDFEGGGYVGEGSIENGSNLVDYTLTVNIPKMEKVKAQRVQEMWAGCKCIAVVTTYNGNAFVIGYDEVLGTDAAGRVSITENIEAELGGLNGYTLTITGKHAETLREYAGTLPYDIAGVGTVTIPT